MRVFGSPVSGKQTNRSSCDTDKKPNPEMIDDVNPEWTDEMFEKAVSLSELPKTLQAKLRRHRGPQKKPVKVPTTIRFDEDVIPAL